MKLLMLASICPPDKIFQVTVSTSHPIKMNGLKNILLKLKDHKDWTPDTRVRFYFVVPPDVYESFNGEQNYHTVGGTIAKKMASELQQVDQYVLNFEF